jgi:hypothetical protein
MVYPVAENQRGLVELSLIVVSFENLSVSKGLCNSGITAFVIPHLRFLGSMKKAKGVRKGSNKSRSEMGKRLPGSDVTCSKVSISSILMIIVTGAP